MMTIMNLHRHKKLLTLDGAPSLITSVLAFSRGSQSHKTGKLRPVFPPCASVSLRDAMHYDDDA